MREKLKEARRVSGMTQPQLAELLKITLRHYQRIEYGECIGSTRIWDALETLFGIPQIKLRTNSVDETDKKSN
ncbi:MAG: helix-turn-helix domain-containing protein [Synergistes sp.]|nr:helix-turn-helix domain-containing protein [Synergistes sp.]